VKNSPITLVLMAGLPGVGKSTLARCLGRELQWLVVDKDAYKAVLVKQGMDDDDASRAAYDISFRVVTDALREQRVPVILDTAALHRFILDAVLEIINQSPGACLKIILCVADRDLRNERLLHRKDESTRIRVDPATIRDYLYCYKHLPADKLVLYTSEPFDEYLARAVYFITKIETTIL
jgi:predicted kinase